MPRKVIFENYGGPDVLKVVEDEVKAPEPNEVQVENKAVGLNLIDTYFRSGVYKVSEFPSSLGSEAAGEIVAVGSKVKSFKKGDRVVYLRRDSYRDIINVPEDILVSIPDGVSYEVAAAVFLKGLTVHYLLLQSLITPKRDEIVLFHAAAGGVGLIFLQWAKHLGLKVIGTVGSDEKAEIAKAHGAWKTINYRTEDVAKKVEELTGGKKVRIVYDSVGKDTWEGSLNSLEKRGLLVSFGNASGPVEGINVAVLNAHGSLYLTRPSLYNYFDTPEKLRKGADDLFKLISDKAIKVQINQTFPLSRTADAHAELEGRRTTGSTVLLPGK